jgi:antitoxin component YwqK of YwqJK toxin-antitoxin module
VGGIEMANGKRLLVVAALIMFICTVGCSREVEKEYYPNGQLKSVLNYKKGQLEGIALYYHENGALKERVNYRKGKRERTGTTYYESSKLKEEITYENGMKVNVKLFGEDGTLISESLYKDGKLVEEKK